MTCTPMTPSEARVAIEAGARLIDIRDRDEHARERIPGAVNLPLDRIDDLPSDGSPVVFHCRSGMRTQANAGRLAAAAGEAGAFLLDGGIEAWRAAGQPVLADRTQPLEIMRQVQIAAGALVLAGVALGFFWTPVLFGLSAFVGAGLIAAGATGWCGMAQLLRALPWNRRAGA